MEFFKTTSAFSTNQIRNMSAEKKQAKDNSTKIKHQAKQFNQWDHRYEEIRRKNIFKMWVKF